MKLSPLLVILCLVGCASTHPEWRQESVAAAESRVGERLEVTGREARIGELLKEPLTAQSAVAIAMLNNPKVAALLAEVGVARAELLAASSFSNPRLDADLRFSGGLNVEASLVQSVLELIFLPLRSNLAESEFQAAQARITAEIVGLAGAVRLAFIAHLAARQQLELREKILSTAELSQELAERLHTAGNITDLDLFTQRARAEGMRMEVAAARQEVEVTREAINDLLGLWGQHTDWTTAATLSDPCGEIRPMAELECCAVKKNLQLDALRAELNAASKRAGYASWEAATADSALGVAYSHEEESDRFGPSFSIPIPIFNWGQAARERASAELHRAEAEYHAQGVHVRAVTRAAWSRAEGAALRAKRLESVVLPLRMKVTAETQRHYNAMLTGSFDLFLAKEEELEVQVQYIAALKEYWSARAAIDQILQGILPQMEVR